MWWDGRQYDIANEGDGRGKPPFEADVYWDEYVERSAKGSVRKNR